MKKILTVALAGAASLALVACGDSGEETTTTTEETTVTEAAPMPTETVTTQGPATQATVDTDGDGDIDGDDSVTISEDGVQANINDGGTSVTADIDETPGVTVRD
jgi:ABC-type Fe3+-hydroxamate transport system substrate-binding protein